MATKDDIRNYICTATAVFTISMAGFLAFGIILGVIVLCAPLGIFLIVPLLLTMLTVGGLWLWLLDWLIENLPYADDPHRFDPSREYGDD